MTINSMVKKIAVVLGMIAAQSVVLSGCAGIERNGVEGEDPKQQVRELASSRWEALIAGNLDKAYEYLSPGAREVMSLELYKKKTRTGTWKKASVRTVSCEQYQCEVTIVIEYGYRDMKSIETRLNEVWLQESGKWWYVPRK